MTDFDKAYAEQTAHIRSLLKALDDGPTARRRRFRDLEIVCGRCGQIIAEVVALQPYRVVRFKGKGEDLRDPQAPSLAQVMDEVDKKGITGRERGKRMQEAMKVASRNIRREGGHFAPLAWPRRVIPEHVGSSLGEALCSCASWTLDERVVYDLLEAKTRRAVWRPRGKDD